VTNLCRAAGPSESHRSTIVGLRGLASDAGERTASVLRAAGLTAGEVSALAATG
jgi:hypothetical protein